MALTRDYLLIGVGTLLILMIGVFLIKLRTVNLRIQYLHARIEDMHILTSRLLLRELNARGDSQVSNVPDTPAHKEGPTSHDQPTQRAITESNAEPPG
jgi:type II secretory pathway component PulM